MKKLPYRAYNRYQKDGFASVSRAAGSRISNRIKRVIRELRWRAQYHPDAVPNCSQIYNVPTKKIQYIIHNIRLREKLGGSAQCDIVSGNWDLLKEPLKETYMYNSIYDRVCENKPWEETKYFEVINETNGDPYSNYPYPYNGGPIANVDNPIEWLNTYERLYESIRSNGYDESYPIQVHIGRDGEFIIKDGCHRAIMSHICDIESVPVKVYFRHQDWQNVRNEIARKDNTIEHSSDLAEIIDHPDLAEITRHSSVN